MKHNYLKHLFTALLLLCTTVATAHDFEVGGIYYNITNSTKKEVAVTFRGSYYDSYSNEYTGSVVIPESVAYNGNTYSVTSIGDYAFYYCSRLTGIELGNSVTSIGNLAFYNCGLKEVHISDLAAWCGISFSGYAANPLYYATILYLNGEKVTNLVIPNSVTSIGSFAFYNCSGLTSVEIPNSVTSIGKDVFYNCKSLKEVHISDLAAWCGISFGSSNANPLYYAKNLYLNGEKVTNLVIPNNVKGIKDYAFSGCTVLSSVEIPNSVTSIGNYAFYECRGLTSVVIPNSVTSIESYAFSGCSGLTSIEIPNSVTSIGISAFSGCTVLSSVEIPNSVTSIANYAFYECKRLASVVIPNSVTSIGSCAFYACYRLTSIEIPNSVTSIGDRAFYNCSGITSVTSLIPADALFAIATNVFYNVNKNTCTFYVPYGAKETYASTEGWNAFTNIVEMEPVSLPGDINADGEVNVGDFAALVNIIFNSESIDDAIKSVSDINADGEVNVGDFAALVNLIFNSSSQASLQRAATRAAADETTFYIEPFSIAAGDTKVIPVLMENPDETFSQLQFDITLPEGLEIPEYFDEELFDDVKAIKHGSRTSQKAYSIQTQSVGEALRVLCITQNSKAYFTGESGDVLLITVKAADNIALGDVEIKITNTVLSRQDGTTYKPADCTATVSVTEVPTGIDDVKEQRAESKDVYYDLSGRAVENPTMGINILNGKKVLIK